MVKPIHYVAPLIHLQIAWKLSQCYNSEWESRNTIGTHLIYNSAYWKTWPEMQGDTFCSNLVCNNKSKDIYNKWYFYISTKPLCCGGHMIGDHWSTPGSKCDQGNFPPHDSINNSALKCTWNIWLHGGWKWESFQYFKEQELSGAWGLSVWGIFDI